jgi:restriction system protein
MLAVSTKLLIVFAPPCALSLLVWSLVAGILSRASRHGVREEAAIAHSELRARREQLNKVKAECKSFREQYWYLAQVKAIQRKYEGARERHEEMVRTLNSRRYRLVHTDWRSLRDIAFEDFLRDVFEELGYSVEGTKTTGDQGVDLIVTGRSERLAVQAKGYKDSVGNSAVQEAYAGMKFYNCRSCAVITNSKFTSGARELARRVNCLLIDGVDMKDLIDGRIL